MRSYDCGFGLLDNLIENLCQGKDVDFRKYSLEERKIMCHSYDDYLLYIWMNLGDTNFNRLGYRQATDIFERAFLRQKEITYAH